MCEIGYVFVYIMCTMALAHGVDIIIDKIGKDDDEWPSTVFFIRKDVNFMGKLTVYNNL